MNTEDPTNKSVDEAAAAGSTADRKLAVTHEPAPGGREFVAEDGAVLGRDFVLPGVAPGENDPYKWHTGSKKGAGGKAAIEIKDVTKQFGRTRILNGLNLDLPDDQISMVLGPSGTGKSVLIKHIVGLLYPVVLGHLAPQDTNYRDIVLDQLAYVLTANSQNAPGNPPG